MRIWQRARQSLRAAGRGSGRALAVFVALVTLLAFPFVARADPELAVDGNIVDGRNKGYAVINCDNAFDATLCLLGVYDRKSELTSEMKAYLSNASTGGQFRVVSVLWRKLGTNGSSTGYYPPWLTGGFGSVAPNIVDGWNLQYGYGRNWAIEVDDSQKQRALEDFTTIINGGTVGGGGGGSGGETGDGVLDLVMIDEGVDAILENYPSSGWADIDKVQINFTRYPASADFIIDSDDVVVFVGSTQNFVYTYRIMQLPDGLDFVYDATDADHDNVYAYIENTTDSSLTYKYTGAVGTSYTVLDGVYSINLSKDVSSYSDLTGTQTVAAGKRNVFFDAHSNGSTNTYRCSVAYYMPDDSGGGGDTPPTPPDTNWPDDDDGPSPEPPSPPSPGAPVSPEPPDPPEPGDPIIDPPPEQDDDTNVTIDLPDVTVNPSGTSATDYTPWLRAILEELRNLHTDLHSWLQSLIDALDNHCLHIRQALSEIQEWLANSYLDWQELQFYNLMEHITNTANWLADSINSYINALANYLKQLSEWIVAQLGTTDTQYDDTSLLYWMRAIYNKLGSSNPSSPNTRPVDPAIEFDPWGEWLREFWRRIVDALLGGVSEGMDDLGGLFDSLKNRFPFSIPWDLLALLTAFGDVPTAPHATFEMDMPEGIEDYEIEIDLSPYDTAMATVRQVELIGFVVYVFIHGNELFQWKKEWF